MFDTMTAVKVGGALCGSLLVFLLTNLAAEAVYHTGPAEHGGEGGHAQAYAIDTGQADTHETEAASGPGIEELLAAADPAAGEKVFGKCKACHKVDGNNATGPHLDGVVGREAGHVEGFSYSEGMKAHGAWTPEALDAFLTNPKGAVPGTKMSFAGLPKPQERADLIAYLQSLGG